MTIYESSLNQYSCQLSLIIMMLFWYWNLMIDKSCGYLQSAISLNCFISHKWEVVETRGIASAGVAHCSVSPWSVLTAAVTGVTITRASELEPITHLTGESSRAGRRLGTCATNMRWPASCFYTHNIFDASLWNWYLFNEIRIPVRRSSGGKASTSMTSGYKPSNRNW